MRLHHLSVRAAARSCSTAFVFAAALACCAASLAATPGADLISRVKAGGSVTIAHRESSVPFSYVDPQSKRPVGYAMDLCHRIVDALGKKAGVKSVPVTYLQVSAADRISVIESGKADLECGSTTNNAERRERVAFTVPHFIAGARLLVRADNPAESIDNLMGKRVASTKGSTPLKTLEEANKMRLLRIDVIEAPDHAKGVEMVEKGQADAFVMDDVLLYGLMANRPNPAALKVVGRYLTTEPLAIMLSKHDPQLKAVADEEMKRLILSREIYPIYETWFNKPIPPANTSLAMPMSYLLKDSWKYPTDKVPF